MPRHKYTPSMIALWLKTHLYGAISQQATTRVIKIVAPVLGWEGPFPHANTGRLWVMRLGLYALTCEKPVADDWCWMIDHTVQLGPRKCLVIVGVRLSVWRALDRALRPRDLHLLNLTPMELADGKAVAEQLIKTCQTMGPPAGLLSDQATEFNAGVKQFQQHLQQDSNIPKGRRLVPHVHDIKHKAAILLKRELGRDESWSTFVKQMTHTRVQVNLTSLALFLPPRLRNKARYMNLEPVISWGQRVLALVRSPDELEAVSVDVSRLEEKLGWLRQFEASLDHWNDLLAVIERVEDYIRLQGYHRQATRELRTQLRSVGSRACDRLKDALLAFVRQESQSLSKGQRLLGHTESLESLLGKYKQVQGQVSPQGMTGSLLAIGAVTQKPSGKIIRQAFSAVPVQAVKDWVRENLGQTIASQQKAVLWTKNRPKKTSSK